MSDRECSFDPCSRPHAARGYCKSHYQQRALGRELSPLGRRALSPEERFWQKVDKAGPSECWLWTGAADKEKGYGQMWFPGRPRPAHRISYELANGPIPDGLVVDHKCRMRSCVNPGHLQTATIQENSENRATFTQRSNSGIRGVSWSKGKGKWAAYTAYRGVRCHVGYFDSRDAALEAVVAKRKELHTNNLLDRRAS